MFNKIIALARRRGRDTGQELRLCVQGLPGNICQKDAG